MLRTAEQYAHEWLANMWGGKLTWNWCPICEVKRFLWKHWGII